ncbi:MAG: Verru_Chthon cassette protein B [Opitutaceae bacterium]|nr:Verru_Chthon cassette protein B [Verrucomicrobiales bacterium]
MSLHQRQFTAGLSDNLSPLRHPNSSARTTAHHRSGFSLVEVVLALGIFSFAIVGIVGLIPIALQTHMDAKTGTIQAQIHQSLAAEALLTDFSKLTELNGKLRYFDEEGVEVFDGSSAQRIAQRIFTSKMVVTSVSLPPSYTPESMTKVIFYAIRDPAQKGISASTKATGSILVAKTAPSS